MSQFNSCFNNGKHRERVRQELFDARNLGIQSTPTFIISYEANGQTATDTIKGAEAFSVFQQRLDAALVAAGAQ
jgi:predicted DsbA family dithiol-disulfide isomerase